MCSVSDTCGISHVRARRTSLKDQGASSPQSVTLYLSSTYAFINHAFINQLHIVNIAGGNQYDNADDNFHARMQHFSCIQFFKFDYLLILEL